MLLDHRVRIKENEQFSKYLNLAWELKISREYEGDSNTIKVRALETISENRENEQEEIEIRKFEYYSDQKVHGSWEADATCCHSDLKENQQLLLQWKSCNEQNTNTTINRKDEKDNEWFVEKIGAIIWTDKNQGWNSEVVSFKFWSIRILSFKSAWWDG